MRKIVATLLAVVLLIVLPGFARADDDPRRMVSGEGNYLDVDAGTPVAGAYYNFVDGNVKQGPCYYSALPMRARVWSSVIYPSSTEISGMMPCDPVAEVKPQISGGGNVPPAPSGGGSGFRPATPAPNWDNNTNCNPGEVVVPSETKPVPYKQSGVVGVCTLTVQVPDGYFLVLDAQSAQVNGVSYPFPLHVYGTGTYQVAFLNGALLVAPPDQAQARYQNLRDVVGPARGIPYQVGGQVPAGW